MILVPRCLSGAKPVPGGGTISVCPSFPWMGFLFHRTSEGSVVVICCPNASEAPAGLGWGRCLSKHCSSASQNGDQNGIFASVPPLKASQHDSSKLCALPHVTLYLFSLFPHFVLEAGASTFNHLLLLHSSHPWGPSWLQSGGLRQNRSLPVGQEAPCQSSSLPWVFSHLLMRYCLQILRKVSSR